MFIGHQKIWKQLIDEADNNRLPPAYLFYGLSGIGKKRVALEFVRHLFCSQSCGSCSACIQVSNNNHPDFYLIAPQGKSISIDVIRGLKKSLGKTVFSAPLKAVVIDDAHDMTVASANSLLKTLEEPPGNTLFILMAPHLSKILPTIRSRCRKLFFSSPPIKEGATWLAGEKGIATGEAQKILSLTEGSFGLALDWTSPEFEEAYAQWERWRGEKTSFGDLSRLSQEWASGNLDLISLLAVMKKRIFAEMVIEKEWKKTDILDRISRAQRDLDRNVNKTLVLENLFLDLRGQHFQ